MVTKQKVRVKQKKAKPAVKPIVLPNYFDRVDIPVDKNGEKVDSFPLELLKVPDMASLPNSWTAGTIESDTAEDVATVTMLHRLYIEYFKALGAFLIAHHSNIVRFKVFVGTQMGFELYPACACWVEALFKILESCNEPNELGVTRQDVLLRYAKARTLEYARSLFVDPEDLTCNVVIGDSERRVLIS